MVPSSSSSLSRARGSLEGTRDKRPRIDVAGRREEEEESLASLELNESGAGVDLIVTDQFILSVAVYLENKCCESLIKHAPSQECAASCFYAIKKHSFGLLFYVSRILQFVRCSRSSVLLALYYVERLAEQSKWMELNDLNVHRTFLACVLVACKVNEDHAYANKLFGKVGGIHKVQEMNRLERSVLSMLDWKLMPSASRVTELNMVVGRNESTT